MNASLVAADPMTHVKVVAVALMAAILVITVGLFANGSALEKGGPFAVIKASNLLIHANSDASAAH
jgi:hypothetical protein